jgi:hypothetical protein
VTQINEKASQTQLQGALRDGIDNLDLNQWVEFQAYTRFVLPLDGYIFWVPTTKLVVQGSLHYSQEIAQNEDEIFGKATVLFTAKKKITQFESMPINTIYVGRINWSPNKPGIPGVTGFRYAFRMQQGFYNQANVWHYMGDSIPAAMQTQLLDDPAVLDPNQAVVSNSLPLWLALNGYKNPYYDGFSNPKLTLFPSFLSPDNQTAPYATVHCYDTRALQAAPLLTSDRSHYQLVSEKVRITLYGLQNNAAMDFVDCVNQYSVNTDTFGIMNMPVMTDGKRKQEELQALAMQKIIEYEVSYYQTRVAAVSRQLIKAALVTYIVPLPIPITPKNVLMTESGQPILTEDGQYILVESGIPSNALLSESGEPILTEDGQYILVTT